MKNRRALRRSTCLLGKKMGLNITVIMVSAPVSQIFSWG